MLNKKIIYAVFILAVGVGVWTYDKAPQEEQANTPPLIADASNLEIVASGKIIYKKNCAECHGTNLEGQPNWRKKNPDLTLPAPPHDASGHTWHHPDAMNFKYTKFGGQEFNSNQFKTAMPIFKDILSDKEILSVLSFIKSKWPKDIQAKNKRMNARMSKGK